MFFPEPDEESRMEFIVTIVECATGKQATYREDYDSADGVEYLWADGNYSCDCNRGLFLSRALGDEDFDVECGDGAFSVKVVNAETMQVVHADGCLASTNPELVNGCRPV
jgi:hypothetical protein